LITFTSGTTRDPKGVIHSHQTLGCETRQLTEHHPPDWGPQLTSAPVGHFIGMLSAFLLPVLGGKPVNLADVWDRSYGSTEHPSITGSHYTAPERKRLYTDGNARPGVDIRLAADGEILSRGPDLCLGYTDPALTAAAFDDEGWYRTGDIGVIDEDGYLTITDRKADIIIRGGENISALEVEEVLLGMPGIAEAAVVAAPDPRLGEHAAAVLRLKPGHPMPTIDEMRAHLARAGLARQKWPEELHAVEDFPRTASGKVQKFILRTEIAALRRFS
jgi:acyl-CoA synthetase